MVLRDVCSRGYGCAVRVFLLQVSLRWDDEKRLKAANHAIDHEMSQTGGRRVTSHSQYVYEADRAAHKTDSEQYE